jgi:hypothetical protein
MINMYIISILEAARNKIIQWLIIIFYIWEAMGSNLIRKYLASRSLCVSMTSTIIVLDYSRMLFFLQSMSNVIVWYIVSITS